MPGPPCSAHLLTLLLPPPPLPPHHTRQTAVATVGDARDDWKIVRALSEVLGARLPYDTLDGVRRRLADVAPHLGRRDALEPPLWLNGEYWKAAAERAKKGAANGEALATSIAQFYQTDAISRASKVMAKCVKARQNPTPGLPGLRAPTGN